ncbi:MAG: hypothetical protein H5U40_04475 [Polyangiaceae bacterium]|nr:hypothetical protein [Polyangiaceae bacterium]
MNEGKGSGLLYVLLGCAGLCVVGLCAATGLGVYMVTRDSASAGGAVDPMMKPPAAQGALPSRDTPPAGPSPRRLRVTAHVVSGRGSAVARGSSCLFDVEPLSDAPSTCRAQIVCGGKLVYGGQSAGYFPCAISPGAPTHVAGRDGQTSAEDGDAAMAIDTAAGTLSVRDDAAGPHGPFAFEARVESVE